MSDNLESENESAEEAKREGPQRKSCRTCKHWQLAHGYMDCGAPDSTTWDAAGDCNAWTDKAQNAVCN